MGKQPRYQGTPTAGKGYANRSDTQEYRDGWERIFGKKKPCGEEPAPQPTPPESEEGLSEDT